MKIGVSGYFGYGNLGDEIFLRTWKQVFHDHDVVSLTSFHDMSKIDRIIIGGGDLVIPSNFTNAYWRNSMLDKPVYVYGVGVPAHGESYEKARYNEKPEEMLKCKEFLCNDSVKYISVRDQSSAKYMSHKLGIVPDIVPDIAWSYRIPGVPFNPFVNTVGISIRANNVFNWDEVIGLLCYVIDKGYRLMLIPVQIAPNDKWGDYALHLKLMNELRELRPEARIDIIPENTDIDLQIRYIEACELYITQRMHGMLMSLRMDTPVIPMAVGIKFYEVMKTLGLKDWIINKGLDKMIATFDKYVSGEYSNETTWNIGYARQAVLALERLGNDKLSEFKEKVISG